MRHLCEHTSLTHLTASTKYTCGLSIGINVLPGFWHIIWACGLSTSAAYSRDFTVLTYLKVNLFYVATYHWTQSSTPACFGLRRAWEVAGGNPLDCVPAFSHLPRRHLATSSLPTCQCPSLVHRTRHAQPSAACCMPAAEYISQIKQSLIMAVWQLQPTVAQIRAHNNLPTRHYI